MNIRNLTKYLPLIVVVALAAFFRFFNLSHLPISLFGDELDIGYQAYSILHTGRDYLGHFFPVYFNSLAEARMPLLVYLTTLPIAVFGLNPFAVRFWPALLGVINVFQIYLLANKLFDGSVSIGNWKLKIGIFASFLLAFSPWHLHYSRAAFDVNLQLALILLGTQLLLNKKPFGFIPYIFSLYAYPTSAVFIPLISLFFIPQYFGKLKEKQTLISLLICLVLLLPFALNLFKSSSQRFRVVSVFSDPAITDYIVNQRTSPFVDQHSLITKLAYNKLTATAAVISRNYLSAFSPRFLFASGDPNFRQSVDQFGELLWITAPLILVGLFFLFQTPAFKFIILWLLVSPLASSITSDGAEHATRLYLLQIPLLLIASYGFYRICQLAKNRLVLVSTVGIFLSLIFISFALYWFRYLTDYKFRSAPLWNYGYEILSTLTDKDDGNRRIFVNNTKQPSLIAYAFYTHLDPKVFQREFVTDVPQDDVITGFNGFRFGSNVYFGQLAPKSQMTDLLRSGDYYFAVQLKEVPGNWNWSVNPPDGIRSVNMVKDIYGDPLFYILTKK